jgi:hypothetical protein
MTRAVTSGPLVLPTIRAALRTPLPYVLAGLAGLAYWAALSLDVLALERDAGRALDLVLGTAESAVCLCAILVAGKFAGEDRVGDLTAALSASAAGSARRWGSRVLGGTLASLCVALAPLALYLYLTTTIGISLYEALLFDAILVLEALALAAWTATAAGAVGTWSGIAFGLALFAAARVLHGSVWAAVLPAPASTQASAAEVLRALAALAGAWLVGVALARRDVVAP